MGHPVPKGTPDMFQNVPACLDCEDTGWISVPGPENRKRRCQCYIDRLLQRVPKRFRFSAFENYRPIDRAEEAALQALKSNPASCFYLTGQYGRGKTHLLYAQYKEMVREGHRCIVRTGREVTQELTKMEYEGTPSALSAAAESSKRVHFFWDDIDKIKRTDFKEEILFDLIDRIYRHEHGLTATSNISLEQLQDILSPAMVRRIGDICQVVQL